MDTSFFLSLFHIHIRLFDRIYIWFFQAHYFFFHLFFALHPLAQIIYFEFLDTDIMPVTSKRPRISLWTSEIVAEYERRDCTSSDKLLYGRLPVIIFCEHANPFVWGFNHPRTFPLKKDGFSQPPPMILTWCKHNKTYGRQSVSRKHPSVKSTDSQKSH